MKNGFDTKLDLFMVESGKLIVSDPCYEKDGAVQAIINNVKNGPWHMEIVTSDERSWGERVSELICSALDSGFYSFAWRLYSDDIGVDSGQAGVFDEKYFKDDSIVKDVERIGKDDPICEDEPWYSICCDRTLNEDHGGVLPFGAVSSSGFGDGCYSCYVSYDNDGKVIAVKIIFIEAGDGQNEDEEPDMYCTDFNRDEDKDKEEE